MIFMDVRTIPFAADFPEYIREEMCSCKVLLLLIGIDWEARLGGENDPVRMEIEAAISANIPVLPLLIGNTPMPDLSQYPPSIAAIASQNAFNVGMLHDFDTHMRALIPMIESILGVLASDHVVTSDPNVIAEACEGIVLFLRDRFAEHPDESMAFGFDWRVVSTRDFDMAVVDQGTTLFLHRVTRLADIIELHFVLSFWSSQVRLQQYLAGWILHQFEQTPVIPDRFFSDNLSIPGAALKIRRSEEDARSVWSMVSAAPLQLSLTYVATISPPRSD